MGNATPTITCTPQTMWTKKSARNGQRHPCHWQQLPQVSFLSRRFCHDKHVFVVTKVCLLRHTCVCHDKTGLLSNTRLPRQKLFRDKNILSRQTRVCRDKTFVVTKMILAAAPASDAPQPPPLWTVRSQQGTSVAHHATTSGHVKLKKVAGMDTNATQTTAPPVMWNWEGEDRQQATPHPLGRVTNYAEARKSDARMYVPLPTAVDWPLLAGSCSAEVCAEECNKQTESLLSWGTKLHGGHRTGLIYIYMAMCWPDTSWLVCWSWLVLVWHIMVSALVMVSAGLTHHG